MIKKDLMERTEVIYKILNTKKKTAVSRTIQRKKIWKMMIV